MDERLAHGVQCPLPASFYKNLTFLIPSVPRLFTKMNFKCEIFIFTLLCASSRFYEGLKGLHKRFLRYQKEM